MALTLTKIENQLAEMLGHSNRKSRIRWKRLAKRFRNKIIRKSKDPVSVSKMYNDYEY
jgi:hypothetical protein